MKTATIEQYKVFGTNNLKMADVKYRGRLLKRITNDDLPAFACSEAHLVTAGIEWAKANGFTHVQVVYC